MSNSQKNFLSIRSKLIAAVAMLLVASFMVVSSTYAWFTLSTAPEVTGITTQIGANGNLEIALSSGLTTIPGTTTGGTTDAHEKNLTWGNILNLALSQYGLNTIVLKPSALVLSGSQAAGETDVSIDTSLPLATPKYGSDGRIEKLEANGLYGTYNTAKGGFVKSSGYGVRAIGTVSTMTSQQIRFTTAVSQLKSALDSLSKAAQNSLENKYETVERPIMVNGQATDNMEQVDVLIGGKLVGILLKGGLNDGATFIVYDNPDTPLNENELGALEKMIAELKKTPDELEKAIKNYMILCVAKGLEEKPDSEFELIMQAFEQNWAGIFTQLKEKKTTITIPTVNDPFTIPSELQSAIDSAITAYTSISSKIQTAETTYNTKKTAALAEGGTQTIGWTDVQEILATLMNINVVKVQGLTLPEILALPDKLGWATNSGLMTGVDVSMPAGSGVYADIASVNKNIRADFKADVHVVYGGNEINVRDMPISMYTELPADSIKSLTAFIPAVPPKDKTTSESDAIISDTYAYVLDFVFRTNAAASNLLLQQDATDRIYSGNSDTTSDTWGGGSYMEFTPAEGFHTTDLLDLMENIRIVFVNTADGKVLAGAGLDTTAYTTNNGEVKAPVKLCEVKSKVLSGTTAFTLEFGEFLDEDEDQVITALDQNVATHISVYVYLDGETVTNADVAALSDMSANGTLNLQFASSAELKPMDYSDLKNQGTQTPTNP